MGDVSILQAVVLALVQGLTEFLPISSSAHLILVPWVLGWPDQGLAFDMVVHLGTLTAVCGYFRHDLAAIARAWGGSVRGAAPVDAAGREAARMGWLVVLATIPVGLAGLLAKDWVETAARNPVLIGTTSILFGLLLWWADRAGARRRDTDQLGVRDTLWIGLAQAVALIPGVSRSGITMTAGLFVGLTREGAARFSFLISIPVIVLSGGLEMLELAGSGQALRNIGPLLLGFAVAATSAYLCIKYLMAYLKRHAMGVFVAYRVALGAVLLWVSL